ncbi:hypothetical protein AUEXF2481DRAFT_42230 [Neofusicoccum parvum]|uniref:Uncharacterized protein n=1 Tax=Neofusicoccum parvum TaxID=310453 RepID=A0ACB5SL19_9PEZI|nr:hypothetical protein AUEXF2481DRAFT_42230 [Neofusicoccum parvum]
MAHNIKPIPTADYDAVIATVAKYVTGLQTGDNALLAQAFHKDATMYGYTGVGTETLAGPISNLYDFVNQFGAAPSIRTRLDVLSITPTTAVVKVDMEQDAAGADYTDFHTLIKMEGRWQIIAKVFHKYGW